MLAEKDPYIKSAYEQLQVISQDKQKRIEYEAREKAIRDHNQLMFEAEERGRQEGVERINKLNMLLIQKKQFDDLERSARDTKFQKKLLEKYGL